RPDRRRRAPLHPGAPGLSAPSLAAGERPGHAYRPGRRVPRALSVQGLSPSSLSRALELRDSYKSHRDRSLLAPPPLRGRVGWGVMQCAVFQRVHVGSTPTPARPRQGGGGRGWHALLVIRESHSALKRERVAAVAPAEAAG